MATTYYVAPCGKDNNDGLSQATAFRNLQKAADIVVPGDEVIIEGGFYSGFTINAKGTATAPIIFKAPQKNAIINEPNPINQIGIDIRDAAWLTLDGFIITATSQRGIRVFFSNHCSIKNCIIDGTESHGILAGTTIDLTIERNIVKNVQNSHGITVSNSSENPIIRHNIIHHNAASGLQVDGDESAGGGGIITSPIIHNNIIYENGLKGGAAINLDGCHHALVWNNLLYENHATGIALFKGSAATGSPNAKIFNNTIINAVDARWCLLISNNSTNTSLINNILFNQHAWKGSIAIDQGSILGFRSDYNVLMERVGTSGDCCILPFANWQMLGHDLNSHLINSLDSIFVNWRKNGFHPLSTSSPINHGTNEVQEIIKNDLDCKLRFIDNSIDIGCYEL